MRIKDQKIIMGARYRITELAPIMRDSVIELKGKIIKIESCDALVTGTIEDAPPEFGGLIALLLDDELELVCKKTKSIK